MPLCRASELDRLLACNGSLLLPRELSPPGLAAEWGSMAHRWMETGEYDDTPAGKLLRKKVETSGVERHKVWPATGKFEVALSYNVENGKAAWYIPPAGMPIEQQRKERDAWKSVFDDEWIVGTADYLGELLDNPWVDDLKTGRNAHWGDFRYQQFLYGIAYTSVVYKDLQPVRSTITHWPRYPVARLPNRMGTVIEPDQFKEFAAKLRQLRKEVKAGKIKLNVGNHCYFCPSKNNCTEYSLEKIYD